MTKPKYIVKGRIKKLNYSTNHKKLRYGSPHFLPLEEICFYNEIRNREYALCENRISVRGRHRSGIFKACRTHIRFLEDLRLHEIENPTSKTLDFIKRNNLLYFQENSREHSHVNEILEHINKQEYPLIIEEDIKDEQFIKAQLFLEELKTLVRTNNFEQLIQDYIAYPLQSHRWKNGRKIKDRIDESFLINNIESIFTAETIESILRTAPETIYPSENVFIVGGLRIHISKEYKFTIHKIETISTYYNVK